MKLFQGLCVMGCFLLSLGSCSEPLSEKRRNQIQAEWDSMGMQYSEISKSLNEKEARFQAFRNQVMENLNPGLQNDSLLLEAWVDTERVFFDWNGARQMILAEWKSSLEEGNDWLKDQPGKDQSAEDAEFFWKTLTGKATRMLSDAEALESEWDSVNSRCAAFSALSGSGALQ